MLFHRLKFSGLLSFGPQGIDLPMETAECPDRPEWFWQVQLSGGDFVVPRRATRDIGEPISRMGGIREWLVERIQMRRIRLLWRLMVDFPLKGGMLRHSSDSHRSGWLPRGG